MNKNSLRKVHSQFFFLFYLLMFSNHVSADLVKNGIMQKDFSDKNDTTIGADNIYIASDNSIQQLFYVIAGEIHKPIIVSSEATKKRVTGNFDLNEPRNLLSSLAERTGLIWYDDGSSIYVYDTSEIKSSVIRLAFAPFGRLLAFMKSSELYDVRYPLRSDGKSGSFYVSGPPVYVELITAAAKYIDSAYSMPSAGEAAVRVIKLKNTFVNDRNYTQRDTPIMIPGVSTVLNKLLNHASNTSGMSPTSGEATFTVDDEIRNVRETAASRQKEKYSFFPDFVNTVTAANNDHPAPAGDSLNIVAYSDTNSLLVKGTERQISFVEDLVRAIDITKRQIQLSLWVIDISKEDVNELGVLWGVEGKINNTGVNFNTSSLTPESSLHFLANVHALVKMGTAQIISRPEILTQENVPALFDNNSSFYAKLIGERSASLQKITYGTMISVLPRLSEHHTEIEMILNIHDGSSPMDTKSGSSEVDSLPVINNTQISTEARVPLGYSLLVGGYTRNQEEYHNSGIPLLRDIPYLGKLFEYNYTKHTQKVRLFLIHPQILENGETWRGRGSENPVIGFTKKNKEITLKSTVSMLREVMNKK